MPDEIVFTEEEQNWMRSDFSEHLMVITKQMFPETRVISAAKWHGNPDELMGNAGIRVLSEALAEKYQLGAFATSPDIIALCSVLQGPPEDGGVRTLVTNNAILRDVFTKEKLARGLDRVQCMMFNELITTAQEHGHMHRYNANMMRDRLEELESERRRVKYSAFPFPSQDDPLPEEPPQEETP